MPLIEITRGNSAVKMARGDLPPGVVFSVARRDGRLGKRYAAIGMNGRAYSVNLDSDQLASAENRDTECTIIGSWKFAVDRSHRRGVTGRVTTRSQVKPGEVFMVKGGEREYAHLGRIDKDHNGWLSVPLDNTDNHAVTSNGNSEVEVVATFKLKTVLKG